MPENEKHQINIEISEKEAEGIYSNFFLIAHSPHEFIIDFARMLPGLPKAKVFTRVILTPAHAKLLLSALEDNIKKYESQFGEIKYPKQEKKFIGF